MQNPQIIENLTKLLDCSLPWSNRLRPHPAILIQAKNLNNTITPSLLSEAPSNLDNSIDNNKHKIKNEDFGMANNKKEIENKMLPKFSDGSFRVKGNTLEYRFILDDKPVSRCGKTKEICWEKRYELIKGIKPLKTRKPHKKKTEESVYLIDYFKKYYETFKIRKNGTKINPTNEALINNTLAPRLSKIKLKNFSAMDAKLLLKEYDDRPNRQKKIYIFMNEVFKMATTERLIDYNPFSLIKLEKYEIEHFNVIQTNEQRIILEKIDDPAYLAFFWYLCCIGLRLDAAMSALYDVDFEKNIIVVSKKDTTTKRHRTTIPFLPELINKDNIELLRSVKRRPCQDYFRNLFNDLGLDLVLHSCRKVFASCSYHVGFSEKWIQDKLCHSTQEMTMNTYVELIDGDSPILDYFRRLKAHLGL